MVEDLQVQKATPNHSVVTESLHEELMDLRNENLIEDLQIQKAAPSHSVVTEPLNEEIMKI